VAQHLHMATPASALQPTSTLQHRSGGWPLLTLVATTRTAQPDAGAVGTQPPRACETVFANRRCCRRVSPGVTVAGSGCRFAARCTVRSNPSTHPARCAPVPELAACVVMAGLHGVMKAPRCFLPAWHPRVAGGRADRADRLGGTQEVGGLATWVLKASLVHVRYPRPAGPNLGL
jgi:hypothetical protein